MGQLMGKFSEPLLSVRRKRKLNDVSEEQKTASKDSGEQTPKKKKLLTTTQYIYQALYKEEQNSDIAVMALSKVWRLHKIYLSQSPYFYSMFNGSWKESCQDFVHIEILDKRITLEALDAVFGSMYSDEIEIDPKAVINILATATLFHLDSIIDKCAEVMAEHICDQNAIEYYESACEYGCLNVKKIAFEWLEVNLLSAYAKNQLLLKQISIELMTALVASPDLYVMQTELSLYNLLRTWVYLNLHPSQGHEGSKNLTKNGTPTKQNNKEDAEKSKENSTEIYPMNVISTFFTNLPKHRSFLSTAEGQPFLKPFQALRTQYLTNHQTDLRIVLNDNIIPKDWLHSHLLSHWNAILSVDHSREDGPQNLEADVFLKNCMRYGRCLSEPGYQKWRWTGFNFGLDLILIANSRMLTLRRHHRNEHERLLTLQTKCQFMVRVSVTSYNSQRQPTFTQKSEIQSFNLEKNEEVTLMHMDPKLVRPLLVSVNLLLTTPANQSFKEQFLLNEEANNSMPISEIGTNSDLSTYGLVGTCQSQESEVRASQAISTASTLSVASTVSASSDISDT